ncbi:nitric oxide synthase oxygenase [Streptomyces barringtoniae]|uniref:nitric oxide synthase oxygenase n=1 Tax=Streptomyces barringtoniae TaxID=2892029 RepID=UPI001E5775ED|nr:nitric oxide synthase oxygenase [Streptomyces barringtoniae]MCC5476425.1 nitric oxide synthase oxygenase [Streptomyces barringtoniae]
MQLPPSSGPAPRRPSAHEAVLAAAEVFIRQYAAENPGDGDPRRRLAEVTAEVERFGTYEHTAAEVAYGARVAWRNAARCIGRLYWNNLIVRDLRHVTHPDDIAGECFEHLRIATNGGRIRPVISVFAPDRPGRPAATLLGEQLVRYSDDPRSTHRVALARDLGWKGGETPFEIMPLLVQPGSGLTPELYEVPEDAVLEVPLTHPRHPGFAALGLRWYAVPAVSDMSLEIGGVTYPAAPFNGWYMGTEIGSRNLADTDRYNLLPAVAELFGLDTRNERTLWRDRALVELNLAVLHSYEQAGVSMADHHTESRRFLAHVDRERRHGRPVPTDWSWIVPPLSGGATAVFHRYYDPEDPELRPAFVHRTAEVPRGCPYGAA